MTVRAGGPRHPEERAMTARIVLLGATGYTGGRSAHALVARGASPVLAGRDPERLGRLASELGALETMQVDVTDSDALGRLMRPGDVVISTVGPFQRLGAPVVAAAVAAGAVYLDSTGEAPFIRDVFTHHGPEAERTGAALLTAFGSDWVPGNLAGALALRNAADAPRPVTRLRVGYFMTGANRHAFSRGTATTVLSMGREPSYRRQGGELVPERTAARLRRFSLDGKLRPAFSVGGTEQFTLPRECATVTDVDVSLGWLGRASVLVHRTAPVTGLLARIPGGSEGPSRLASAVVRRLPDGPTPEQVAGVRTQVVAEAFDAYGTLLGSARVDGPEAYAMTADLLAWGALRAAEHGVGGVGALGPVEAFGLDALLDGAATAGIQPR